jgi:DNA invertase Pin-like site-specific DNA recombinase
LKRANSLRVAVGYMRVAAGERQISLAAQRVAIEAWATRQGIAIASWKADEGVSGEAPIAERPGLVAAYGAVREHGAGVLVAAKRDRFACDVFVAGLVEQAALANGAMVRTADGGTTLLVSSTATRGAGGEGGEGEAQQTWTRGAVDLFVAYQRAVNRARTREALAAKRARGERIGAVPYGYRLAADGLHLEADAAEQAVLLRVRELAAAGLSQREIVEDLAAHGVVGRTGAPLQKTQVARMLLRVAA